jgi:hypothetical protein
MYPGRELNPYKHYCSQDFKSCVSTNSTTRAGDNVKEQLRNRVQFSAFAKCYGRQAPPGGDNVKNNFEAGFNSQRLRSATAERHYPGFFVRTAGLCSMIRNRPEIKKCEPGPHFQYSERETRLELATPTLARSCSTN